MFFCSWTYYLTPNSKMHTSKTPCYFIWRPQFILYNNIEYHGKLPTFQHWIVKPLYFPWQNSFSYKIKGSSYKMKGCHTKWKDTQTSSHVWGHPRCVEVDLNGSEWCQYDKSPIAFLKMTYPHILVPKFSWHIQLFIHVWHLLIGGNYKRPKSKIAVFGIGVVLSG